MSRLNSSSSRFNSFNNSFRNWDRLPRQEPLAALADAEGRRALALAQDAAAPDGAVRSSFPTTRLPTSYGASFNSFSSRINNSISELRRPNRPEPRRHHPTTANR